MNESDLLVRLQKATAHIPGVLSGARALSFMGEHSAGWLGLAGVGACVEPQRRKEWLGLGAAALGTHAASVVIKRIVRRPRPHDPRIKIGVKTPSQLSFPSSHATSTTAAMVFLSRMMNSAWPLSVVPIMMCSRMVLGVHYPTDVTAGALLGAAGAELTRKIERQIA
ncbi:phosphatase PAP2 family protein [Corynebacterium poyangense]|uniref:Phosphatase PAP2 family protein n=1 Tax=Corynebacterium poyangense TaxID=2684405 RepID=A0A7H0SRP0_9CORY|nr:phosphatase PAP2 family protein [Corynebacterium poyangense]QNQ91215.1 phosphatase PAP2 family protein [Corynebacterium poyangense]